jgi:hypothetical protein
MLGATMVVAVTVALVGLTLRPRQVPTYSPTAPAPQEAPRRLVGPIVYTVDATQPDAWRHFSFRQGSVIDTGGTPHWDLGFRRYAIIAGPGAGILDLGERTFDEVRTVPAEGYQPNEGAADPRNPAIAGWYDYGFFSHVLTPRPRVWAVRTADGRYAKLEMIGYYCPQAQPGCVTFRYAFQGDGSNVVGGPDMAPHTPQPLEPSRPSRDGPR